MGISGLTSFGDHNTFQGNFTGTDVTGTGAVPNERGFYIESGIDALVGGPSRGMRNLISGNSYTGVSTKGNNGIIGTVLQGNFIGVGIDGATHLCNGYPQAITGPADASSEPTLIGNVEGSCLI